jgi:hypothetical protein
MSYVWTSDGNLKDNNHEGSTQILRFLQWCNWRFHSSWAWSYITRRSDPGILRQHSTLTFKSQNVQKETVQPLKTMTICSIKTLESDYPVMQHRVPEQNSQRSTKVKMFNLNNVNKLYQHFTANVLANVELSHCLSLKWLMFTYVNAC